LGQSPKEETIEQASEVRPIENQPFTFDMVKDAWAQFAESRKIYRAEYQLLTQKITLQDKTIILHLHNPVQETLLSDLKSTVVDYIREKLKNSSLQVTGELQFNDDKKVIYTNREKFEHLAKKNPNLTLLKERLGLDPDF
jgi:hypothetical protein